MGTIIYGAGIFLIAQIYNISAHYPILFTKERVRDNVKNETFLLVFFIGFSFIFLTFLILNIIFSKKEKNDVLESRALFVIYLFVMWYLLAQPSFDDTIGITTFLFLTNIIYTLMIVGIIFIGFKKKDKIYLNIGLIFFVIDIFVKYFDLFFKILLKSLFFIIEGVMLHIGGIYLEKKRRKRFVSFQTAENNQ